MKIRVMVTDDQRLMREGLQTILSLEPDIAVVGLAENGKDALDQILSLQPDVVLMDIRMPIMDGVECTRLIKQLHPNVRVLILTTFDDDEYIIEALRNGASGYILKDLSGEKLVMAIHDAYRGDSVLQNGIAAKAISHISAPSRMPPTGSLTYREKDVLRLVGKGMSNTEIASNLFISEGTVKNYISNLYSKLELTDRTKLALYAIKHERM